MTVTTEGRVDWASPKMASHIRKRHRGDIILQSIGIAALVLAGSVLAILILSLVSTGYQAMTQTHVTLQVQIDPALIPEAPPAEGAPEGTTPVRDIAAGDFEEMLRNALAPLFPDVTSRRERRDLEDLLTASAKFILRDEVLADPSLVGTTYAFSVPVSDPFDQLNKGLIDRETPEQFRRVSDLEISWFDRLDEAGVVATPFNWALLTAPDSIRPELAGLAGALVGSFYALLVCFLVSFPVGIAAGIYLEEFAPKNKFTDLIEVNINNLAAVPSVVFGLLALAVFLGWFGMPRSAPLVGGLTLALMTLPTIIIATRAAVKAVPPSIREAALGLGASKFQVTVGHVLPLAMPGILTGTIIGLAQALGETAPLLLIGMNASIAGSIPTSVLDASTALPTQIFIWADSPERGFVSRTSAAILVLLVFLVVMNAVAIYLRKRFERRW